MAPTLDLLSTSRLTWAAVIVLVTMILRFWQRLHYHRRLVKGLPGPPHSYFFGSLISMGKVIAKQPGSAAPQTYPSCIKEHYKLGDWLAFDPWPFGPTSLAIFDPEMAHEFTVKQSLPKHHLVDEFMHSFGGEGNLVSSEGAAWKKWRSAFNPGFSAAYLMTLVPSIVDNCDIFCSSMLARAKTNELFRMEASTTNLTVDIIGKVVLDHDLNSQIRSNELVDAFISQTIWQPLGVQFNPIEIIDYRIPIVQAWNTYKMNRYIGRLLDERFSSRATRNEATGGKRQKYVIDLALEAYLKEAKGATSQDDPNKITTMDPAFRTAAISNIKTFLFAGHDTTSSTICYAYYYLSKNPAMLARIRAEHDTVFGTDPKQTSSILRENAHLLNKLDYTTAVIKESLRMQPPASTVRMGQKGFFLHDPQTGEAINTEGLMLWAVDVGLHRNATYWPDPNTFQPERFLQANNGSAAAPANPAFVPFSKGPRNCIGQELAMIESRIILALTMRLFDFAPAYDEIAKLNGDGYGRAEGAAEAGMEQFGDEAWQVQKGTAKPRGGMPCRLSLRC
jgi:cytochrome P450